MLVDGGIKSHERSFVFPGLSLKSKQFSGVKIKKTSRATRVGAL